MQQLVVELERAGIGQVRMNEPLSSHTTWKIGGPADVLIVPASDEELEAALRLCAAREVPWTVLGRGSNTLVSDKGVRGAVIKLGDGFDEVRFDGETVTAGASYSFIKLSVMAGKEGLTGLEYAGGIPGSVGGAVYMNAGAHGSDISRILQSASIVWEDGSREVLGNAEMKFSYRHSVLQERRGVITRAEFRLASGDRKEIAAAMATYKDRRRRTQPLQMASAGSVFRNPPNDHAARLIEAAGLKGLRQGAAEVSQVHANFIVNHGGAKAEDVLTLIGKVQQIVEQTYGITLVTEVRMMGER
ncbi:UDP-N-acetylenolpyruvoylglucosamine reductase [Cohnella sp. CIP 111063]|uniref:UDP-N-acetylmuramate dehydrogenase n=1 Tax=unclassified Cohnella TaxID=2636738 RepID=UPI000B8BF38F|nr:MULTISPECIES: UDP-N-acetylmuramate dehydrogenase [unclassified Cohnella]OXS62437.1 UDP-N-acetylenolpyruvoylglucosamine reductase [Cohnella sp. CIP 111063]PRX74677.1 UDP-N-acetylmuramate dehydrogenase [Cohnella sp. SGD-V74]